MTASVSQMFRVVVSFELGKRVMPTALELVGSRLSTEQILYSTFYTVFCEVLSAEPRGLQALKHARKPVYKLMCRVTEAEASRIMDVLHSALLDNAELLLEECEQRGTHAVKWLTIDRVTG